MEVSTWTTGQQWKYNPLFIIGILKLSAGGVIEAADDLNTTFYGFVGLPTARVAMTSWREQSAPFDLEIIWSNSKVFIT